MDENWQHILTCASPTVIIPVRILTILDSARNMPTINSIKTFHGLQLPNCENKKFH
jgi:hypothetical protein